MILPPNNYLITNYVDEQQEQRMHPTYASVIQQRANIKLSHRHLSLRFLRLQNSNVFLNSYRLLPTIHCERRLDFSHAIQLIVFCIHYFKAVRPLNNFTVRSFWATKRWTPWRQIWYEAWNRQIMAATFNLFSHAPALTCKMVHDGENFTVMLVSPRLDLTFTPLTLAKFWYEFKISEYSILQPVW